MSRDIKAKPTIYRGVEFRSKLEARWAREFDSLKWEWYYEPTTFRNESGIYTPDFIVKPLNIPQVFVEIKPIKLISEVARQADVICTHYFNVNRQCCNILLILFDFGKQGRMLSVDDDGQCWMSYIYISSGNVNIDVAANKRHLDAL